MHAPGDVTARIKLPEGRGEFDIALDPSNLNENYYLEHFKQNLYYEPEVVHVMARVVKPGDYCIDVGAHIGFFTLLLSRLVGETGHVLAFEPGTNNLPKLKHNIAINKISNVELIEFAAWNEFAQVLFYINADSSGGNALWDPGEYPGNDLSARVVQSYAVKALCVDEFAFPSKLIKIDVEGAEQCVLEGLRFALSNATPSFIIVEIGPFGLARLGCSTESMRSYMRSFGYDLFLIHGNGSLPTLVPPKTEITHQMIEGLSVVMNVLFSTIEAVGEYWRKVPYE